LATDTNDFTQAEVYINMPTSKLAKLAKFASFANLKISHKAVRELFTKMCLSGCWKKKNKDVK